METIWIPQLLQAREQTTHITLADTLPNFATLTSIRGELTMSHGGTFLEVWAKADTIVTLTCDRCLQQYNHRLSVDTTEIIWLTQSSEAFGEELWGDDESDDLAESLPRDGYFDPQTWLYEQLCLAMPLRQLCQQDCQAVPTPVSSDQTALDHRWASLADLKKRLSS